MLLGKPAAARSILKLASALSGLALMLLAFADEHSVAEGKLPELFEITPSSASWYDARTEATIRGAGFMPSGNVVQFGWVTLPDLSLCRGNPDQVRGPTRD